MEEMMKARQKLRKGVLRRGYRERDDLNAKGVPARAPIGRTDGESGVRRTGDDAAFDRSVQRGKVPQQSAVPSSLTPQSLRRVQTERRSPSPFGGK